MHLGNASDFCCLFAYAAAALARDQQMHFAQLRGCSHDRQRCVLYRRIVMFNPNQRLHHATPRALSLPPSPSTSATLMSASLLGGSATFSVVRRGATSTPYSAGLFFASGLDLGRKNVVYENRVSGPVHTGGRGQDKQQNKL